MHQLALRARWWILEAIARRWVTIGRNTFRFCVSGYRVDCGDCAESGEGLKGGVLSMEMQWEVGDQQSEKSQDNVGHAVLGGNIINVREPLPNT